MVRSGKRESYLHIFTENLREHWLNRTQVARLSVADLKKTYHGAALGWSWAVIKPVFTIFIYWFAIDIGLRSGKPVGDYPYILWLMAGIIPWFFMNEALTGGTECIRRYSYLVTKMKFPVMTIPTFTNLSKLFVHVCLIAAEIIVFWCAGYPPTVYMLQIPIYMLLMFLFFNAWALFAGMVSAIGKDFSNLVRSLTVGVFWLSGIIWNVDNLIGPNSTPGKQFLYKLMMLNPVTFICYGYRNAFLNHTWIWDQPKRLLYFLCWYVLLALLSLWAYRKLYKEVPDVL